jgi:hypothetical protein
MDADWRRQESPAAGVAQRLVWRTNRLRCMTHEEIGHRVLRALAMQAERWGLLRSASVPAPDLKHARQRTPWSAVPTSCAGSIRR